MSIINPEHYIISNLINNEEYFKTVIPFLKEEYFIDQNDKIIFKVIKNFVSKYSKSPDYSTIKVAVTSAKLDESMVSSISERVDYISGVNSGTKNKEYLVDMTEKFCRDKAMYCAINKAVDIYDGTDKVHTTAAIQDFVKSALAISFNPSVGHDYDLDAEERFKYRLSTDTKIPFDNDILNAITNDGVAIKTLNLVAAGVNVGKTLMMIILGTMYRKLGYDVLYVTNEVSTMELGNRFDAAILGIDSDLLVSMSFEKYINRLNELRLPSYGKLIIEEYPTGTCDVDQVRSLLQELKLKKDFKPKVIINDYLTICRSARTKDSGNMGEYYTKVAEEWRALAVEEEVALWSVAQFTTEAMDSTDPSLNQLASSQGIARTADLVWAVYRTEVLDGLGQIGFKQLKTRYHRVKIVRWTMGLDIGKHRLSVLPDTYIDGVTDKYKPRQVQQSVKQVDVIPTTDQTSTTLTNKRPDNVNTTKSGIIFKEDTDDDDEYITY